MFLAKTFEVQYYRPSKEITRVFCHVLRVAIAVQALVIAVVTREDMNAGWDLVVLGNHVTCKARVCD